VLFGSHKLEHDKPNQNMADVRQGSTLLTGKNGFIRLFALFLLIWLIL
jgi:hypothetical protein